MVIYLYPSDQFADTCSMLAANNRALTNPDFSFVLFDDDTAEVLGASLRRNRRRLELSMSAGGELTVRGAKAVARGLRRSHVIKFQFWDKGVSPGAKEIMFRGLQPLTYLNELHLKWALDETDATSLWRSLNNKRFELFSCRISPNITRHGVNALVAICRNSNRYEVRLMPDVSQANETTSSAEERPLSWSFHMLGEGNLQWLAIEGSLTDNLFILTEFLTMGGTRLPHQGPPTLIHLQLNRCFNVVPTMQRLFPFAGYLEILRLHNCEIDDPTMRAVCQVLHSNRSIWELSFKDNRINDDGVEAFVSMWPIHSPMEHLSLSSNDITVVGARRLLTAASSDPVLDTLDLSHNPRIGFSGLLQLAQEHLRHVELEELDLSGCGHSRDDDLADDQVLARQTASDAMLEAARSNFHLASLKFDEGEMVPNVHCFS